MLPSKPQVFTALLPKLFSPSPSRWQSGAIDEINDTIATYSAINRLPVVDIPTALSYAAYFQEDGVHPNETGAYRIAAYTADAIKRHYGPRAG
jgi:lysophospholipase L1-like esterase